MRSLLLASVLSFSILAACGQDGAQGPQGAAGAAGDQGGAGVTGGEGVNGEGGAAGGNGANGANGAGGENGTPGAPIAADPVPTSGARIKARRSTVTTTTADGASQSTSYFSGWFDSQRNEACTPTIAADGKQRCLPAAYPAGALYFFADAGCAQQVLTVSTAPTPAGCAGPGAVPAVPQYVSTGAAVSATCSGTRIVALGPKLAISSLYYRAGASCYPYAAVPSSSDVYSASGAEVPASEFAEFTTTTTTL